jgi:hypothetical protein
MNIKGIAAVAAAAVVAAFASQDAGATVYCPAAGQTWYTTTSNTLYHMNCVDGSNYIKNLYWEMANYAGAGGESESYSCPGSNCTGGTTTSGGTWWSKAGVQCANGSTYWSGWTRNSGITEQCPGTTAATKAYLELEAQ